MSQSPARRARRALAKGKTPKTHIAVKPGEEIALRAAARAEHGLPALRAKKKGRHPKAPAPL